jgi:hypothetical protein
MVMFHHQNVGHSHDLLIADKSFQSVAKFKYVGTSEINHEEIILSFLFLYTNF